MEADLTVTKLAADRFLVVATDTMHRHVASWMDRHVDKNGLRHQVHIADVTGAYAQVGGIYIDLLYSGLLSYIHFSLYSSN